MVVYNFKRIQVVPSGKDFVDIVLSATQRKTPTEIHKQYAISRIRTFYMRKVKFAQQTFHDKLTQILDDFPVLDDLHPFYGDLLNILYDKDHYKLALGQLSTARRLIDNLAQEHVRFLKFGDSLYRCKQLKRAALGRMCTIIKHQSASLAYLEQVRQHLARLPSIDPSSRTLICTGYPTVGKSSMLNRRTSAKVDVQPYAFTTKSLFVGHMDYERLRWQIIDTPGLLDHPLENRNTIEMQSITALAHLRAAVLFVIDISTQCGFSIEQQVKLFESIKPLFAGKPLIVALNKIDVVRPEALDDEDKGLLRRFEEQGIAVAPMSTLTAEGVDGVKKLACDTLLAQRIEEKLQGAKAQTILNRLHLATPVRRDNLERPPCIPPSVARAKAAEAAEAADDDAMGADATAGDDADDKRKAFKKTRAMEELEEREAEIEALASGENPWTDWKKTRENYILENPDWKYDIVPEIIDGKNIADFIDPDIMDRLEELEREEDILVAQEKAANVNTEYDNEQEFREAELADKVRARRRRAVIISQQRKLGESHRAGLRIATTRTADDLQKHLVSMGVDPGLASEAARSAASKATGTTANRPSRKRTREEDEEEEEEEEEKMKMKTEEGEEEEEEKDGDDDDDDEEMGAPAAKKVATSRSKSRSKSRSLSRAFLTAVPDEHKREQALRHEAKALKNITRNGRKGEADRRIVSKMPKHLFSGKRKSGTTQRR